MLLYNNLSVFQSIQLEIIVNRRNVRNVRFCGLARGYENNNGIQENKKWEYTFHASIEFKRGSVKLYGILEKEMEKYAISNCWVELPGEGVKQKYPSLYNIPNHLKYVITEVLEDSREFRNFNLDLIDIKKKDLYHYLDELIDDGLITWSSEDLKFIHDFFQDSFFYDEIYHNMNQNYKYYQTEFGERIYRAYIDDNEFDDNKQYMEIIKDENSEEFIPGDIIQICVGNHLVYEFKKYQNEPLRQLLIKHPKSVVAFEDVLVRTKFNRCVYKDHPLERIHAKICVFVLKNYSIEEVTIEARFCPVCGIYYILEEQYSSIKQLGSLCCQHYTEKEYIRIKNSSKNTRNLRSKSILNEFGYNVQKNNGLSPEDRRRILIFVRDNGILSEDHIISFLNWLINRNRSDKFIDARRKWSDDLQYLIENRSKDIVKTIKVKSIYHKTRIYY